MVFFVILKYLSFIQAYFTFFSAFNFRALIIMITFINRMKRILIFSNVSTYYIHLYVGTRCGTYFFGFLRQSLLCPMTSVLQLQFTIIQIVYLINLLMYKLNQNVVKRWLRKCLQQSIFLPEFRY